MKKAKNIESKQYNSIKNIWYLLKEGWKHKKSLYFFSALNVIFNSISPFISIVFTKLILDELTGRRSVKALIIILGLFFCLNIIFSVVTTYLGLGLDPLFTVMRFRFVREHYAKCMEIDFQETEDADTLNLIHMSSRAISGNYVGIEGVYRRVFSFIGEIITFIGFLALILYLNPFILLYLLITCLVIYAITLKIKKEEHEVQEKLAVTDRKIRYTSGLFNDVAYGKEIRLFDIKQWIMDKYTYFVDERISESKVMKKKYLNTNILNVFFNLIREGIVYAYLIVRFLRKTISIGDFAMYFNVTNQFTGKIRGILDSIAYIQSQNMYINDYREFMEYQPVSEEGDREMIERPYTIEFRNVSFQYPNSDKPIIKNFSYTFQYGKRIALVGYNGAGKTTLIKLMIRLYDPTEGEILLNGINIKEFSKQEYYKLFSVVYQDFKTFAFSINENIALNKEEDIDFLAVQRYLKMTGLEDKVKSLPKQAQTSLLKALDYEGVELSGGENQKMALARALYKNGDIFVLDEPTAALDPLAESAFYQMLNEMVDNEKIYIFISHRLASTRFCDEIIMLEDGRITEQGSHNELIQKQGEYYKLFELQAKNYREEVNDGKLEKLNEA